MPEAKPQKQAIEPNAVLDPERWLQEHGDAMYNYAMLHLREPSLAEELVQESFLSALKTSSGFAGRSSERSWLIAILKHKIIDHIRKASRRRKYSVDIDDDDFINTSFKDDGHFASPVKEWIEDPQRALQEKEFHTVLVNCIDALPERLARVFTLRELEELDTGEICKILDISSTNLWVMLHRARLRLRKCLAAKWFEEKD